jgi:hypothetical protein
MEQQLTEQQAKFVTRIKGDVNTGKFVTNAFIKIGEEDSSTYNIFKQWLFEYCMANNIFFLEKRYFILVGLSQEMCEHLDERLTKDAADSLSKVLHSVKMLDTVKNVN